MQIIRLNDRNRWIASVAAIALLAGVGGILVGRSMSDEQTTEATAEEGEEHGSGWLADVASDSVVISEFVARPECARRDASSAPERMPGRAAHARCGVQPCASPPMFTSQVTP